MNPILELLLNKDFPALAHNIGLALITILIPVGILLLGDKREFEELDKHVVLDYITQSKKIIGYIILIFFPFLFWKSSFITGRIIEIFLWAVGLWSICKILQQSYLWIKGNKFPLRFGYLKSLSEQKDMEATWKSVWQTEKINSQNEKAFFDIFSSKIDELL